MAARLDLLVPELRDAARALVDAASAAGLQPRVTSTLRSRAEQTRLYRRYLAGQAGYPVVAPGTSAHEYGMAFDMVVSPMEALADVGYTWQTWGGGWNPGDAIHFELLGATDQFKDSGVTDENIVQRAATAVASLPWYLSIFLPLSTMTKTVDDTELARIKARACQLFGLGCSK